MDPVIVAAGALYLIAFLILSRVGYKIGGRPVTAAAQLATIEFSTFWFGLSLGVASDGIAVVLSALGDYGFNTALTLYLCGLLLDTVVLGGLLGYLVYVYSGKYHLVPLFLFYAAFYVAAINYVVTRDPFAVQVLGGVPSLVYANPSQGPVFGFVLLGLVIPPYVGAFAYLSLLRRTSAPDQRFRIALVGSSILLWFTSALFGPTASTPAPDLWTVLQPAIYVLVGVFALLAFFPPRWVRERLWGPDATGGGGSSEGSAASPSAPSG